ncbi:hypothetical protein LBMAG57_35110 [Verrucomicrobiota bacterium]|nr:hypothetical protein LBMAG57_35110 [Verrucomicrobiota bacterium]
MRTLSIPSDFAQRDEVRLLARVLAAAGASRSEQIAPLIVFRLWLDWARGGKPHRPYSQPVQHRKTPLPRHLSGESAPDSDALHYVIECAVDWVMLRLILGMPEDADPFIDLCVRAGVLIEEPVAGIPGLTLSGFAECNEHLHPEFESQYRKGPRIKKELARLRAAEKSGTAARKLLAQSAFEFPADNAPTDHETDRVLGFILQIHSALDLGMPKQIADWSAALMRDTLHIIRSNSAEDLERFAHWILQNHQAELPEADPAFIIQHFTPLFARLPAA